MAGEKGESRGDSPRSRRSYLKLAGLTATAAGLGGVVWGFEASGSNHRTVNLREAGADNTGEELIDDTLSEVADDDTTVEFPEGTYRLESFRPGPLSNFTLEGADATLVPPQGSTDVILGLMGNDVTVRGITFDYSAKNTAPRIIVRCSDGLTVENCTFVGVADVFGGEGRSAHQYHLMPSVTHPDGEGVVRNVSLVDGSISPSNRGGIWVSGDSAGRLRFEDVHIAQWANNSLYVSESDGRLVVVGSRFVNNNVAGPRIGAETARIVDTEIVSDGPVPIQAFTNSRKSRGLWIDDECERVLAEGCEFRMTGPFASSAIRVNDWSDAERASGSVSMTTADSTGPVVEVVDSQFTTRKGIRPINHTGVNATVNKRNLTFKTVDT